MTWPSRSRSLGGMRLEFGSHTEVAVIDTVPTPTSEVNYPLLFALLYAGKLLYNFPGTGGQSVVARAYRILGDRLNDGLFLTSSASMLGLCCETPLVIVSTMPNPQWVYTGELLGNLTVITAIAHDNEDHFHRAAIDTVLEVTRRRLGNQERLLVPLIALEYFTTLLNSGCNNLARNNLLAAAAVSLRGPQKRTVSCWRCKAPIEVTSETRGKKVRCHSCGTKQAMPI